ncbi:discoidin domain-containing protein [bacterium]|nr:discoidin domain-containing protein [bacterium]
MRKIPKLTHFVFAIFLSSILFAEEVSWLSPNRPQLCLNGNWQFQGQEGEFRLPEGKWDKVPIRIPSPWNVNSFSRGEGGDFRLFPSYPEDWEKYLIGWHRRTFTIPPVMEGMRLFLRFEAVHYYCEVYLNGKKVGAHEGGFTPFEFDITDFVNWQGENELLVGVKDKSFYDVNGLTPYPWGSFWGGHIRGIWQDVYLIARPQVYIDDIFVNTSYRNKEMKVKLWIQNKSASEQNLGVFLSILDKEGKEVPLPIQEKPMRLAPDERGEIEFVIPWNNPRLWSPDDPYLYTLVASIHNSLMKDEYRLRFGFREFWIEGNAFYLNGKRIKLRGDAWHYMGIPYQTPEYARLWFKMAKETGLNHIRLHAQVYPSFFLDIADEEGILITNESAIWASACNFYYNDDFWRRASQHIREFVLRDRNHPSVVIWSVANEIMASFGAIPHNIAPSLDWVLERIYGLVREIKELDGTRPVSSDGDEDIGGRGEIFSLHYPGPNPPKTQKPITIGESGSMFYSTPPEVAPTAGEDVYLSFSNRLKGVGEELRDLIPQYRRWAQQITPFNVVWYSLEPLPITRVLSYEDLQTPGVKPERWGPFCSTLNPGYDPSLPPYKPNSLYPYIKELLQPITFFISERNCSFFSGEKISRTFTIFNDISESSNLELRIEVLRGEEKIFSQAIPLSLAPCEFKEIKISFALPQVPKKEAIQMNVALWKENKGWVKVKEEHYKFYVYPPIQPTFPPLIHGDPNRLPFQAVPLADIKSLTPQNILIIAKALDDSSAQDLLEKVEEGGKVLVLEPSPSLLTLLKLSRQNYSVKRAFAPFEHPILKGIEKEELLFWRHGKVANGGYSLPISGTIKPIIFCGAGEVCFLEIKRGKGTILLSEMDILNQVKEEPTALAFLINSLEYLRSLDQNSYPQVGLLLQAGTPLSSLISSLGLQATYIKEADLISYDVVICDGRRLPSSSALRDFLDKGGRLLLLNPIIQNEKILNEIVPSLKIFPLRGEVQLIRAGKNPLSDGLHLDWLYWLERNSAREIANYYFEGDNIKPILITSYTDWRKWNWQGENIKTAAILKAELERSALPPKCVVGEIEIGKGKLILCGMNISPIYPKFLTAFSLLLSNLGLEMRPSGLPDIYVDENGYIMSWLVLGPFEGKDNLEMLIERYIDEEGIYPQEMTVASGRVWRKVIDSPLNFKSLWNKNYAIGYAGIYLYSPKEREAYLHVGSDDSVMIWLDGKLIWRNPAVRPLTLDSDKIAIKLSKGWHRLLFKVTQLSGEWGLSARIVDGDGNPLEDIRYSLILPEGGLREIKPFGWVGEAEPKGSEEFAFDRDVRTRWSSNKAMEPGMFYILDLGREEEISMMVLDSSLSPGDYPRGLRVEVSLDKKIWQKIAEIDAEEVEKRQWNGILGIDFPKVKARYIKLTQLGSNPFLFWSIHEIYLY